MKRYSICTVLPRHKFGSKSHQTHASYPLLHCVGVFSPFRQRIPPVHNYALINFRMFQYSNLFHLWTRNSNQFKHIVTDENHNIVDSLFVIIFCFDPKAIVSGTINQQNWKNLRKSYRGPIILNFQKIYTFCVDMHKIVRNGIKVIVYTSKQTKSNSCLQYPSLHASQYIVKSHVNTIEEEYLQRKSMAHPGMSFSILHPSFDVCYILTITK